MRKVSTKQLTVVWQTVIITVALSITGISRHTAETAAVTIVFPPVTHHAVLQSEPSMTNTALKWPFTCKLHTNCRIGYTVINWFKAW